MPIDQNFPKNPQVTRRQRAFSLCMDPGRSDAESSTQEEVQAEYKGRGEESTTVMVIVYENGI